MFVGTYLNLRFKAVQRGLEWGYDFFFDISNKIYQNRKTKCTAWLEEFYFETQKSVYCKVASRSTCYYSGNQVFGGATNTV